MEEALARMMGALEIAQNVADTINEDIQMTPLIQYETDIVKTTEVIKAISATNGLRVHTRGRQPKPPKPKPLPPTIARDNSILRDDQRAEFAQERVYEATKIFTAPLPTTVTMEGVMVNVLFHEKDLILACVPDNEIVAYRCNFGKHIYPGYTEPIKHKHSDRGRKKLEKKKKNRKKQGDGTEFSSQLTFVIRSSLEPDPVDGIIPENTRVYKFKLFRTGKIQLPGARPEMIEDVVYCAYRIAAITNKLLHPDEPDESKHAKLLDLVPVMKNYKFACMIPPRTLIDLNVLKQAFEEQRRVHGAASLIHLIKYTRQDTKLSIKFNTPIVGCAKKRTRVNIFMRGKINILGANDAATTRKIIDLMHNVFLDKWNKGLIAYENQPADIPERPLPVASPIELPEMPEEDYNDIWNLLSSCVDSDDTNDSTETDIDDSTDSDSESFVEPFEQYLDDLASDEHI